MIREFEIDNLHITCGRAEGSDKMAYILYPMDMLDSWIEPAVERYGVSIAVITGMEWQDVLSPWPARGVPKGSPDFKGEAPAFLGRLRDKVLPQTEDFLGLGNVVERTLVGVSMSGLFALWQWMLCDTFNNIASLSGSFWYEGFVEWMKSREIPHKAGNAFFLLGDREAFSRVKAFAGVGASTQEIIRLLGDNGIKTEFRSVPGNHYSDPLPRLNLSFDAFFSNSGFSR